MANGDSHWSPSDGAVAPGIPLVDARPLKDADVLMADVVAQRNALLEVARIEHALQMQGFTKATAQQLGPDALDAYLSGGVPGLNNWRRQKREAAIANAEHRS